VYKRVLDPSSNHVTVPVQPVASSVVGVPAHIVVAVGVMLGAVGIGFTVTTTLVDVLLQVPFTQTP
jgi:hypothetical protein